MVFLGRKNTKKNTTSIFFLCVFASLRDQSLAKTQRRKEFGQQHGFFFFQKK